MKHRLRGRLAPFVKPAVFGVTVAALAVTTMTSPVSASTRDTEVVAIGDSVAAGVGATYPKPGASARACRQTLNGYPVLLAADLAPRGASGGLRHRACSGATTKDALAQVGAVSADTDVVTITVGANDVGWTDTITRCSLAPADCQAAVDAAVARYRKSDLVTLLAAVDREAAGPGSGPTVLVTGYPRLYSTDAIARGTCPSGVRHPGRAAAAAINSGVERLNAKMKQATATGAARSQHVSKVRFVELDSIFRGHLICSSRPWINALPGSNGPGPVDDFVLPFHPNDAGHRNIAQYLLRSL